MPSPLLTPNEAQRAIYIDFEGNTDTKPTLLGILYKPEADKHAEFPVDVVEQWVLEPAFYGSVDGSGAPTGSVELLRRALELIAFAKKQKRRIVSWSQHDFTLIMDALVTRPRAQRTFKALYRDAKRTGEAWSKSWPSDERPEVQALTHYLKRVGYEVPAQFGPGLTGESLRVIRKSLETHQHNWQRLTRLQRERFHAVLMHNRHDLLGMRAVVEHATTDLQRRGTRELLRFLDDVGTCTKPICTTCGSLEEKRSRLRQFVAGGSVRDMLTGITKSDLRRRSLNLDWLVELLRQLPKGGVRVVLRAWKSAGVLGSFDLSVKLVSDERVLSLAPRTVRNALRDVLREEALRTSAEWIRNILFAHFDDHLASDDPVRIAHAAALAESLVRREADSARNAVLYARLADDRNRAETFQNLSQEQQVELVCNSPVHAALLHDCISKMSVEQAVALPRTFRYTLQRRLHKNRSVAGKRIKGALHTLNAEKIMRQRETLEQGIAALPLIDQLQTVADSPLPVGRFSLRIAESGLAIVSALPDVLQRQLVLRLRPQHKDAWAALRRAVEQHMLFLVEIPSDPTH